MTHTLLTDDAHDAVGHRLTALVVVESMFGNTEQVARAVAAGLGEGGVDAVVVDVASAPGELPEDLHLLVIGAPTHAFSLSRPGTRTDAVRQGAPAERAVTGLREWLSTLLVRDPRHSPVTAVFDTRVSKVRPLPTAAAPRACRRARRRGLTVLTRPEACLVSDVKGPLADGELERAAAWGCGLAGASGSGVRPHHWTPVSGSPDPTPPAPTK
jgi:hypothetical protein